MLIFHLELHLSMRSTTILAVFQFIFLNLSNFSCFFFGPRLDPPLVSIFLVAYHVRVVHFFDIERIAEIFDAVSLNWQTSFSRMISDLDLKKTYRSVPIFSTWPPYGSFSWKSTIIVERRGDNDSWTFPLYRIHCI